MQTNELIEFKPGPELALGEIAATVEAVKAIQDAYSVLTKTYEEVIRLNNTKSRSLEPRTVTQHCEWDNWRTWQAGPLRTFNEVRYAAADTALAACKTALQSEVAGLRGREDGLSRVFRKLLKEDQAGADLALLLNRLTGGIPEDGRFRTLCNAWESVREKSRRALVELPKLPPLAPVNSDHSNELEKLLKQKGD